MILQWIKKVVISREVATFCFFLVVASLIWLMFTIGTQREMVIPAPVVYYGVPDNIKLANELPSEVQFTVQDDGSQLLSYFFTSLDTIKIDLTDQFAGKRSLKEVKINYLPYLEEKMNVISSTCTIVEVEPAIFTSSYSKVYTRRVKVKLGCPVHTGLQYTLLDTVDIQPKEILIRGTHSAIDTVRFVYVDSIREIFSKSKTIQAPLIRPKGVELLTKEVTVAVNIERQTEKSFTLPIEIVNVPEDINVHLFPDMANVIFNVGLSKFNDVKDIDFKIVFDLKNINDEKHTCKLQLINSGDAQGLNYRIVPEEVEYIFEKL